MSMKWLTILQFLEIVSAYGIVTLFLPWLILRKRVPPVFRCGTDHRIFFFGEFLYHLSGVSAAVSAYQQSRDADPRNCGTVSWGLDLEEKKQDSGGG